MELENQQYIKDKDKRSKHGLPGGGFSISKLIISITLMSFHLWISIWRIQLNDHSIAMEFSSTVVFFVQTGEKIIFYSYFDDEDQD